MVNKKLRSHLLGRLKVTKQALSLRAQKYKKLYGPMTTEEAVYCIAHAEGLDLTKYLSLAMVDRVRALVPRVKISPAITRAKVEKKTLAAPPKPYPLLSRTVVRDSFHLGEEVYPTLFQLESSIRAFVVRTLSTQGSGWWVTCVPPDVQRNVQRTIDKEKRYPYRDHRGNQPIYYSNFDDLKKIICAPANEAMFKPVIVDLDWFKVRMDEVYMARNNIAHCVAISSDDAARIYLLYKDWARLLESAHIH